MRMGPLRDSIAVMVTAAATEASTAVTADLMSADPMSAGPDGREIGALRVDLLLLTRMNEVHEEVALHPEEVT